MSAPAFEAIRARAPGLLALAALTVLTTGLVVVAPARVVHGFDRSAVTAAGPDGAVNVVGSAKGNAAFGKIPAPDALVGQGEGWRGLLPPGLARATDPADPFAFVGPDRVQRPRWKRPGFLRLFVNPSLRSHVRFLSGDPDGEQDGLPGGPGIFVTQKVAALFELKVGSPVRVETPSGVLALHVAGIIEAVAPDSPYWAARQSIPKPWVWGDPKSGLELQYGGALMGPKGYSALRALGAEVEYTWRFPLRQDRVTARSLRDMIPELDRYRATVPARTDSVPSAVQTPMDGRIREFAAQYATAQVVTGLAFGGLAAVLAGSLLTGVVLFSGRLRGTLTTMRARGASRAQLLGTVSWLTVPVLVPAVAVGLGLGVLVRAGPLQSLSVQLAVMIGLVVVVVPWVSAAGLRRDAARPSPRPEAAAIRPSRRRLVLEGLVVVLAVLAVLAMRRRGLAVQSQLGTDPLVSAVPVLLGVGTGLLVLRVLPWPLRFAGRLFGRGRSAVGFVGLARASRRTVLTLVPLVVLLLAAAVGEFGATVDAALAHGQRTAAWHLVGSDARITAGALAPDLPGRLPSVRGVTGAVPLRLIPEAVVGAPAGEAGPRVIVLAVDLAAYKRIAGEAARFVPDAPAAPDGVLASPSAAASLGTRPTTLAWMPGTRVTVRPSGIVQDLPGLDSGDRYVIIPYRLLQGNEAFPTQVFVQGHGIDRADLDRVARRGVPAEAMPDKGTGFVRYRDDVERAMVHGPMARVMHRAFGESAVTVSVFGLLTVLLTLLVGARERGRAVAHLEVLGLGRRQRRLLAVTETGPPVLAAALAGWLLGFLLPRVTGPMLDLRPYTSGYAVTDHAVDPLHLTAFAGALAAAALVTVLVDRIFDARHRLGEVLRTGEET